MKGNIAHDGFSISRWYKKWKPAEGKAPAKSGDLYERLMTKVNTAIKDEKIATVTFIWMQGERDAKNQQGEVYAESLKGLIGQVQEDFKRKDINVVVGRLSDFGLSDKSNPHWTIVRKAQVEVAEAYPRGAWVDTDDLNDGKDALHYSVEGYRKLGERFAEKSIELIKNNAR